MSDDVRIAPHRRFDLSRLVSLEYDLDPEDVTPSGTRSLKELQIDFELAPACRVPRRKEVRLG